MERRYKKQIRTDQSDSILIRHARVADIPRLVEIEEKSFQTDKLSRRNFHWLIKHGHSIFLGIFKEGYLIGYGVVLINKGTSLARLYSIALDQSYQGLGYATQLIKELERRATDEEDCAYLRLEVSESNIPAMTLYEKLGFKQFAWKEDYYEDGKAAICYEKRIRFLKGPQR